ncbi:anti-sigma factor [Allorhizobium borbori]|uniref:Anti-sigma-K factor RskA n=1 Tax=Allorhizobium borbori TaxID=485907 RepID=A0A7W6P2C1_9HYPH|nr:anti-sigma factor [Allorhizobium borbori]MBB4103689.1 anti-sigma-K factor RskA [Allorhizobium borbori]
MTTGDEDRRTTSADDALAGEYVLGVLSTKERREVEARMVAEPAFARLVERWQADTASWNGIYGEAAPDPVILSRIESRLFGAEARPPAGLWHSLAFWRGLAFGSCFAAFAAVIVASGWPPFRAAPVPLVAELSAPGGTIALLASYNAADGRMKIVPAAAPEAGQKSLELWVVPGSGSPKSLGVLEAGAGGEIVIPAEMRAGLHDGVVLAVTVEPFGGSPTGLPTGPVIVSGAVRSL